MKKLLMTAFMLLAFLSTAQAESPAKKSGLQITDINGKSYTVTGTKEGLKISGMEGKVVFLEFFGHQCPPCLASIPHLSHLQKKYKDKLAIIGVEVQGLNEAQLKAFVKRKGINYTVISGEKERLFVSYISERSQWVAKWRGSIPFLLVLDGKGEVQYIQAGMLPESTLETILRELSKKPKTDTKNTLPV
jgi:thiol-disulfide isomerase/thioredoxin